LNAVTRIDTNRLKKWRRLPKAAQYALYACGGLVAIALIFQFFFRYEYLQDQGLIWRVDRLTQQMCQVNLGKARCATTARDPSSVRSPATSTSTSTSTSISVSPSLKIPAKFKRH
jgi:hypothetical protein